MPVNIKNIVIDNMMTQEWTRKSMNAVLIYTNDMRTIGLSFDDQKYMSLLKSVWNDVETLGDLDSDLSNESYLDILFEDIPYAIQKLLKTPSKLVVTKIKRLNEVSNNSITKESSVQSYLNKTFIWLTKDS